MKNDGDLLKPGQDAAHHPAEPARPALALGLDEATEGIDVMAEDAGSLRRQFMGQLAVAVIADMENVKCITQSAGMTRIIPEPIEKPIAVGRPALAANSR